MTNDAKRITGELTHKWTEAGFGTFPFRVRGVAEIPSKSLGEKNPAAYQAAMALLPRDFSCGTCDVCGRSIMINFLIESADGMKFVSGSSCVKKSGDLGMITKIKHLQNKRNRERAAARREAQRLAKLEEQRQRNGGLTDYELAEKKSEARKAYLAKASEPAQEILDEFADNIEDHRGGFCDSVARSLRKGVIVDGRGESIMIEILAKEAGRKGSAAFCEEFETLSRRYDEAKKIFADAAKKAMEI